MHTQIEVWRVPEFENAAFDYSCYYLQIYTSTFVLQETKSFLKLRRVYIQFCTMYIKGMVDANFPAPWTADTLKNIQLPSTQGLNSTNS
jgi:hypothetical protein